MSELSECSFGESPDRIDYAALYEGRFLLLKKAFDRSRHRDTEAYAQFCCRNSQWLDAYADLWRLNEIRRESWLEWPDALRRREPETMRAVRSELAEETAFWNFCQFKFDEQWQALRELCAQAGYWIIGDIPIYAAMDSADTWSEPEVFYLDPMGSRSTWQAARRTPFRYGTAVGKSSVPLGVSGKNRD